MAGQTYDGLPDLEVFVIATVGDGPATGLSVRDLQAAIHNAFGRALDAFKLDAMGDRLVREDKVCRTLFGGNFHPITHDAFWCGHGTHRATDFLTQPGTGVPKHMREST